MLKVQINEMLNYKNSMSLKNYQMIRIYIMLNAQYKRNVRQKYQKMLDVESADKRNVKQA